MITNRDFVLRRMYEHHLKRKLITLCCKADRDFADLRIINFNYHHTTTKPVIDKQTNAIANSNTENSGLIEINIGYALTITIYRSPSNKIIGMS